MDQVNITQAIDNKLIDGALGYIDKVESEIKSVTPGNDLNVLINSQGGDIFQGRRLFRAILEHEGPTKSKVVGFAASMAGLFLAAFDHNEMDIHSRAMLHKAHLSNSEEPSKEDKQEIKIFNETAHALLKAKAEKNAAKNDKIDLEKAISILDEIFLSDSIKDYWFSAIEMRDVLGIVDEVTDIQRVDGKPERKLVAIANEYKNQFLNSFNKMGLFDKKSKGAPRILNIKDGRQIIFNSTTGELKKGDNIAIVDSDEEVNGKIAIDEKTSAEVKDGQIVDILNEENDSPINMLDEEQKQEISAMIQEALKPVLEKLDEMSGGGEGPDDKKDKKEEEEEKAMEALKAEVGKISKFLSETQGKIVGGYTPPKAKTKNESFFDGMSPKEKEIVKKVEFVNEKMNK